MWTSGRWPLAGAVLFVAAATCLVGFAVAPLVLLAVAAVILIAVAVLWERLGSWRIPVIVTSASAMLLASGMLLISVDFGADDCADGRCVEEMPASMVPIPG